MVHIQKYYLRLPLLCVTCNLGSVRANIRHIQPYIKFKADGGFSDPSAPYNLAKQLTSQMRKQNFARLSLPNLLQIVSKSNLTYHITKPTPKYLRFENYSRLSASGRCIGGCDSEECPFTMPRRRPPRAGAVADYSPIKILTQIFLLQAAYYACATILIVFTSLIAGKRFGPDLVLSWRSLRGDTTVGWTLGLCWMLNSFIGYDTYPCSIISLEAAR